MFKHLPEKLEKIHDRYQKLRFEKLAELEAEVWITKKHFRREPTAKDGAKWKPCKPGMRWGDDWETAWFRTDVKVPKEAAGQRLFLHAGIKNDEIIRETLLFINNEPRGVFTVNHHYLALTQKAKAGQKLHISLEAYAGHYFPGVAVDPQHEKPEPKPKTYKGLHLALEREDVTAFCIDLRVLLKLFEVQDEDALRHGKLLRCFEQVFTIVNGMPHETDESEWRPKLAAARHVMRPLLAAKNGDTMPLMHLLGNSHIDTAWLWPLAETERKCARTFSLALSLMERYPEYLFIQPAVYHADIVKRECPSVFKDLKRRVKEGRWEPNGCMWVEPDGNIPSGESFIRQILYAHQWTEREYGMRGDVLWLPDTFGYSANLPQILTKCGIRAFCTQKLSWNDTTKFPYETFRWRGIEGSEVLSHFMSVYVSDTDPKSITEEWKRIQHPDRQEEVLMLFGWGDGGGGPTAEQIETTRRLPDLEGMPRTEWSTASNYMKKLREREADFPRWTGEIYLEMHRGSLTSMAKIKRGNRKCEVALRDLELVATWCRLNNVKYPADEIEALWKTLLVHQFHDILPGTSIARVNDEAEATFAKLEADIKALSQNLLQQLQSKQKLSQQNSLQLVNTLNWSRRGEIQLAGVPKNKRLDLPDNQIQNVTDLEGNSHWFLSGIDVPALESATIPLKSSSKKSTTPTNEENKSPFRVTTTSVETPFAKIRFDKAGFMSSFVDKRASRQLVTKGGKMAYLLAGESVPRFWDNWDIDPDQHLKMSPQTELMSREVVADGPLQLRIRCVWKVGTKSELRQDTIFHSSTPRIDFETIIDWRETHQLLKACFDLNLLADHARHEIQLGHVERPTHTNQLDDRARFEVCAHKWTDLSENGFGVAVLNDCKYGVSVDGTTIGLTLMKAGTNPDPRGDNGIHHMTYSLLPHEGNFSVENVVRPAYELNTPLIELSAPKDSSAGKSVDVFAPPISTNAENIIIETIKPAERKNAFAVRFYDAGKLHRHVKFQLHPKVKRVFATDFLEENDQPIPLKKGSIMLEVQALETQTLVCEF
jgi:alpha-mannosidase